MILLRRAKKEDLEFLYKLKMRTMKKYVEKIWSWNEELQRSNILKPNNLKRTLIIISFGQQVGSISVFNRRKSISLERIEIFPEFQGKGIGTDIVKRVISISLKIEKPLFLQVLKINKIAQKFYEKLGFIKIGENSTHYNLKYKSIDS